MAHSKLKYAGLISVSILTAMSLPPVKAVITDDTLFSQAGTLHRQNPSVNVTNSLIDGNSLGPRLSTADRISETSATSEASLKAQISEIQRKVEGFKKDLNNN